MSVYCEFCVLSGRSLRRADHSSRAVLPNVVYLSVIVKPRQFCSELLVFLKEEKHATKKHSKCQTNLLSTLTVQHEDTET